MANLTPLKLAEVVRPGDFVGEYVAPRPGSEGKVPVLDVYRGEIPQEVQQRLGAAGVKIYEFMPLEGEERDTTTEPFGIAAIEGIARKDGHVGAKLTLAVAGAETTSHTSTPNPMFENRERFGRLLEIVTRGDDVDRLYMNPEDTNLQDNELAALGWEEIDGDGPAAFKLDLPVDKRAPTPTAGSSSN